MDREKFESLDIEEQAKVIQQSPIKEKGDLVLHSHDPVRLTQSFSHEELYLVLREMDLEEKSELIRCADLRQLFFVSDIDCWKRDRIDPAGFVGWLEALRQADENKLLAWLLAADQGTTVAGFMKIVRVLKPEWEYAADETIGDEPYFTLDNYYYVLVREEDLDTVRRALNVLYENHRGRYVGLMEAILAESEDELEEEAYRRREARLADYGFPEKERAGLIYRPMSTEEFERFARKTGAARSEVSAHLSDWKVSRFPVLWKSEVLFLDEVLRLLWDGPAEVSEGIREELVWLSNKVVAAAGLERVSEETVRFGVERARAFVNLGLEILSGRDAARAAAIVKERWLETVFRRAVGELTELRKAAEKVAEDYGQGDQEAFLEFLGLPYGPIFRGLLRFMPQHYASQIAGDPAGHRDFRTAEELEKSKRAVAQLERVLAFLSAEAPAFYRKQIRETVRDPDAGIRLTDLLQALFAGFVVNGRCGRGLPSAAVRSRFFRKAFENIGGRPVLVKSLKEEFLGRFFDAAELDLMRPLWALVFDQTEDDYRAKHRLGALDAKKNAKKKPK